jgi:sec-independent protein translocase protein TatC
MEALPLRAVAHDERLTITEHVSELRARLMLGAVVQAVLFAGFLWKSRALLHVLKRPARPASNEPGSASSGSCPRRWPAAPTPSADSPTRRRSRRRTGSCVERTPLACRRRPVVPAPRAARAGHARTGRTVLHLGHPRVRLRATPRPTRSPDSDVGVRRPRAAARRAMRPSLMIVPALFAVGVAFGYFLVLPLAVKFLQGFNRGAFECSSRCATTTASS